MKIFKGMVGSDKDGSIFIVDMIEYENSFWLVPEWLGHPTLDYQMPARIIKINKNQYQKLGGDYPADILLSHAVPSSIMEGKEKRSVGEEYETIEKPDIKIPINFKPH